MQPCRNIWMIDCQVLREEFGWLLGSRDFSYRANKIVAMVLFFVLPTALPIAAQKSPSQTAAHKNSTKDVSRDSSKPKLVVILVVDQMRGDYIDKFQQQWTGGLKRLVDEGAWFHEAAYPYGATETCVGHSTISTGAFPASHGMIGNEWWDREQQKEITCTADGSVKNIAYDGSAAPGGGDPAGSAHASTPNSAGDSAVKMLIPVVCGRVEVPVRGGHAYCRDVAQSPRRHHLGRTSSRFCDVVGWSDWFVADFVSISTSAVHR